MIHSVLLGRIRNKLYSTTGECWKHDRHEEISLRRTTIKKVQNGFVAEGSQEVKALEEQGSKRYNPTLGYIF